MDKQKSMVIAIVFLGISVIIGSMQIADSLNGVSNNANINVNTNNITITFFIFLPPH